jgi:hypothetical protein
MDIISWECPRASVLSDYELAIEVKFEG